jgi:hypothetical protein
MGGQSNPKKENGNGPKSRIRRKKKKKEKRKETPRIISRCSDQGSPSESVFQSSGEGLADPSATSKGYPHAPVGELDCRQGGMIALLLKDEHHKDSPLDFLLLSYNIDLNLVHISICFGERNKLEFEPPLPEFGLASLGHGFQANPNVGGGTGLGLSLLALSWTIPGRQSGKKAKK